MGMHLLVCRLKILGSLDKEKRLEVDVYH